MQDVKAIKVSLVRLTRGQLRPKNRSITSLLYQHISPGTASSWCIVDVIMQVIPLEADSFVLMSRQEIASACEPGICLVTGPRVAPGGLALPCRPRRTATLPTVAAVAATGVVLESRYAPRPRRVLAGVGQVGGISVFPGLSRRYPQHRGVAASVPLSSRYHPSRSAVGGQVDYSQD